MDEQTPIEGEEVQPVEATDPLATQQAQIAIEQEKKERSLRCHKKVQQALDEENCFIDVMMILKAGKIIPQADIVAK